MKENLRIYGFGFFTLWDLDAVGLITFLDSCFAAFLVDVPTFDLGLATET